MIFVSLRPSNPKSVIVYCHVSLVMTKIKIALHHGFPPSDAMDQNRINTDAMDFCRVSECTKTKLNTADCDGLAASKPPNSKMQT
jgi:hypothetical protein